MTVIPALAEARDLAELVPEDAVGLLYIRDVPALQARAAGSAFGRFSADPRAADFVAPLKGRLAERGRDLPRILGPGAGADLKGLSGGFLAAEFAPGPKVKARNAPYLILFEAEPSRAAAENWLPALPAPGAAMKRSRVQGAPLGLERIELSHEVEEEVKAKKGKEKSGALPGAKSGAGARGLRAIRVVTTVEHLWAKDGLVMRSGADPAPILRALERLASRGPEGSLAAAPRRRGALGGLAPGPQIEIYADLAASKPNLGLVADAELLGEEIDLAKLGLDRFMSAAFGVYFSESDFRLEASLYVPPARAGLARLLFLNGVPAAPGGGPGELAPVGVVPADALGYAAFGSDLPRFWRELRRTLREGAPQLGALLDVYFSAFRQSSGADFEEDVIAHLGHRAVMFARMPPARGRKARPEMTYAIEVASARAIRPALMRWIGSLAATFNFSLEEEEAAGHPVYRLVGAEQSEGALVALEPLANICLTDRWLILSPRIDHIRAALAAAEGGAEGADFRRAAAAGLAPDRFFEAVGSPGAYGALSGSPIFKIGASAVGGLGDSVLAMSRAPGEDVWLEYFGPVLAEMRTDRERLIARWIVGAPAPKP